LLLGKEKTENDGLGNIFEKLENFWAINFTQQRRDKIENEKFNSSALSVSDVNKFQ